MRRAAAIFAWIGLSLSLGAWAASYFRITWRQSYSGGLALRLQRGTVQLDDYGTYTLKGWTAAGVLSMGTDWWPQEGFFQYNPPAITRGPLWMVCVPLWMPTVVFGASAAALTRFRRIAPPGTCAACGYDLAGLAGPCPECGGAAAAQPPRT